MTNYEKIKNMSVEEMNKFIFHVIDANCSEFCKKGRCKYDADGCLNGIKQWLNSEAEDES